MSMSMLVESAALSSSPPSPLAGPFEGRMVLAPLTRGGNLPFRRLCADHGMRVGVGEMVFARNLLKGDRMEAGRWQCARRPSWRWPRAAEQWREAAACMAPRIHDALHA